MAKNWDVVAPDAGEGAEAVEEEDGDATSLRYEVEGEAVEFAAAQTQLGHEWSIRGRLGLDKWIAVEEPGKRIPKRKETEDAPGVEKADAPAKLFRVPG